MAAYSGGVLGTRRRGAMTVLGILGPLGALVAGAEPLTILDQTLAPGVRAELQLVTGESFAGTFVSTPVIVVRGVREGPKVCLVAGIHGDELNGIEIVRRVLERSDPATLRGTIIGIPIANIHGFRRSSRYLPDRRDLNRYFPGRPEGSAASRIAHRLFDGVVRHCEWLVDFHTGSFHRTNLPQIRADLRHEAVREAAIAFGGQYVIHSIGTAGTLRRAAVESGIAAITYEAGEPMELHEDQVEHGVRGVVSLLQRAEHIETRPEPAFAPEIFTHSRWIRSDRGGILLARVALGDEVEVGDHLGTVTDPLTNEKADIIASVKGRVIGLAVNQVVIPGFAAFNIGITGDGEPLTVEPGEEWAGPSFDPLDEPFEVDERVE